MHAHDHPNASALAQACLKKSTHASAVTRVSRLVVNMVAEHWFRLVAGERISERICEQIADVHVPQVVEQIIEVPKMAEQILDVLVLDRVEQLVKLPNDDGIQQQTAGYITVIPVSQDVKELVVVFKVFSQDRIQQRTVEQTIPVTSLAEKIVEFPVIQTEERTQQGVNTHAQHVVNTVEVERPEIIKQTGQKIIIQDKINQVTQHVEVPLSQFNDKVVDNPVVAQRQIYMVMTVQKSIEIPQLQVTDQVVDVPVVVVAQVPQVHVEKKTVEITQLQPVAQVPRVLVVEKTTEIPQFRVIDKVVDVPVVSVMQVPRVCAVKKTAETPQLQEVDVPVVFVVQAPLVQVRVVIKTVEDSWFQIVEKTAEAPQTQTIQVNQTSEGLGMECDEGHELMLQGNDLVCVVKDPFVDVKAMTKEDFDLLCCHRSGSMRQQHKQRATAQTAQEEERGSEGRKVREGEKKKGGQVEKEQGREETEKGRKGQWERDQEGR